MSNLVDFIPKWTVRVATDFGGRDPLGLSRLSQNITDYLLTGIITQTYRARYFSFYSWALWHIDRYEAPPNSKVFEDAFRRRESTMALATLAENSDASLVGKEATKPKLDKGYQTGEFDCDFPVLPSNRLGGFRQYYAGCLNNLGLITATEDGIYHAKEGYAIALAEAFQAVVEQTPFIKKKLYTETTLKVKDMEKTKTELSLDTIRKSVCKKERNLLIDLFFGFDEKDKSDKTMLRRQTLGQFLYLVDFYEQKGYHVLTSYIDRCFVLAPHYYKAVWVTDRKVFSYKSPDQFATCSQLWKQYCLHRFLTHAMECLLYAVLETIGVENGGLSLGEIIPRLLQPEFFALLKEQVRVPCKKPLVLLKTIGLSDIPDENMSLKMQSKIGLLNEWSELQVIEKWPEVSPQEATAKAVMLLSILYGKWRGMRSDLGFASVKQHVEGGVLWSEPVLWFLDTWFDPQLSWEDTLKKMIQIFVIDQHDRVTYEKGRLESSWFIQVDGRLVKQQDYAPTIRSSRHWNVYSILYDLNLIDKDEEGNISMTKDGQTVLSRVNRIYHG